MHSISPVNNPQGSNTGETRVLRGGSWLGNTVTLCVVYRSNFNPTVTFNYFGCRCVSGFRII